MLKDQQQLNLVLSIPAESIRDRIIVLGKAITCHYTLRGIQELTLIPILDGAMPFAADLMRVIGLPCRVAPIRLKSYQGTESSGQILAQGLNDKEFRGRDVLIVEDILDTGMTFSFLAAMVAPQCRSFQTAVLLNKHKSEFTPTWSGFSTPADAFVVGYGLDYNGYYRNLPDLYVATPPTEV